MAGFRQTNPNLPFHRAPITRRVNVEYGPGARNPFGPGADSEQDPLGIGIKSRARQHVFQGLMGGYSGAGNLPDWGWEGFKQAMAERGVDRVAGGPSAEGSNQIRGQSVQPDYVGLNASERLRVMGHQAAGQDPYEHTRGLNIANPEQRDDVNEKVNRSIRDRSERDYSRAIAALRGLGLGR